MDPKTITSRAREWRNHSNTFTHSSTLSQKYVTPEKEDLKITLKGKEKEKENYYSLGD